MYLLDIKVKAHCTGVAAPGNALRYTIFSSADGTAIPCNDIII